MTARNSASQLLQGARKGLAVLAMAQMSLFSPLAGSAQANDHDKDDHNRARTPIKHVIVIVGENRSFDHIFATYEPKNGESVDNLLSKKIVKEDGTPGTNFAFAHQYAADATDSPTYQLAPKKKTLFSPLPAELTGGPADVCKNNGICTLADAMSSEDGLAQDYYQYMLTGGSELSGKVPDSRINGINATAPFSTLLPGPFQLTNNTKANPFTNDSYAESPVHRFYQMWQQEDCDVSHISKEHPNGCLADLFAWTEVTVGSNVNGNPQPASFSTQYAPGAANTGEGATTMGFYNMAQGDAPYTKYLADHYAISDNYHQPAMGGTGLDSILLFFGDPIWFSDGNGNPATPPHNELVWSGTPDAGTVDEIENPNPQPGTNNWWIQDGYGGGGYGSPVYGGGSYTNCSDPSQSGVAPILAYLSSLPRPIEPKCDAGHYYLLNNYNPGYFGDGSNAYRTIMSTTRRSRFHRRARGVSATCCLKTRCLGSRTTISGTPT